MSERGAVTNDAHTVDMPTPDGAMVLEHAVLDVRPGESAAFEATFAGLSGSSRLRKGSGLCNCCVASRRQAAICCWSNGTLSRITPKARRRRSNSETLIVGSRTR